MKLELSSISIDTIIQAVSIIAAAVTFVVAQSREKRKDRRVAAREAYQQIELAAIEIFRFEAGNLDTIRPVWEQGAKMPKDSSAEYTATMNYVCQMLNLFEIALRFRKQKYWKITDGLGYSKAGTAGNNANICRE